MASTSPQKWPSTRRSSVRRTTARFERADAATRKATGWETVYRRVETGNLLQLDKCGLDAQYELVVSADVLCYFGDLKGVLSALAAKTAPGGDLIFTVETLQKGDWRWVLQAIERLRAPPGLRAERRGDIDRAGAARRRAVPAAHGERPAGPRHAPRLHKPFQANEVNSNQQQTSEPRRRRRPSITRRTELVSGRGDGVARPHAVSAAPPSSMTSPVAA